ncbi:MAG: hypothetical protein RLZZ04_1607 [Cyanobacteriota bacterium]|jgi:hypothetical protein
MSPECTLDVESLNFGKKPNQYYMEKPINTEYKLDCRSLSQYES